MEWTERFLHKPPFAESKGACRDSHRGLPLFTVIPGTSGNQLVRASLPFPPGALPVDCGLTISGGNRAITPDLRVLTVHPGSPVSIRRAIVSFPYVFKGKDPVVFAIASGGLLSSKPAEVLSQCEFHGGFPGVSIDLNPSGICIELDSAEHGLLKAELTAPDRASGPAEPVLEVIEQSNHYLWVRLFIPDVSWPRIIEVRADSLGTVCVRGHLQRGDPVGATAPDFGWRLHGAAGARFESPNAARQGDEKGGPHKFFGRDAMDVRLSDFRLQFPTAHLDRRGGLEMTSAAEHSEITYHRCRETEGVPHQEGAWREAAFTFGPRTSARINPFLEPDHRIIVAPEYYEALYGCGEELDLTQWPDLERLQSFHREGIAHGVLQGDDYGNFAGYPPASPTMNRLNFCPPIFAEYFLSGCVGIRASALAWCVNNYDIGIYWNAPDEEKKIRPGWAGEQFFGGTRYNNMNDRKGIEDNNFAWRSNSAVTFCTKGFDPFFYAWEETGDPRMAVALHWQIEYARQNIRASKSTREVGVARDWVALHRFTGRECYLSEALKLYHDLQTVLTPR